MKNVYTKMERFEMISVDSFNKICRTCLIYYHKLYFVKDIIIENVRLRDILNVSASIQIDDRNNINQELPQKMCTNCILKFYEIDRFLKQCKQSQTILYDSLINKYPRHILVEEVSLMSPKQEIKENYADTEEVTVRSPKIEIENYFENAVVLESQQQHHQQIEVLQIQKPTIYLQRTKGPYICEICSATFDKCLEFRKHWQSTGHRPKKFSCKFCNKRFCSQDRLTEHLRTHTGEKPYACNVCNKRFASKCTFGRHLLTHSKSKRYKCSSCDKGFIRIEFLRNHERKYHTGEKLLCPFCGKEFTSEGMLRVHEKKHHTNKEDTQIVSQNMPNQCNKCGKIYATEVLLQEHIEIHAKVRPYPTKHQKKQPKEGDELYEEERKYFICEHCQENFINKYLLRLHLLDSKCTEFVKLFPCNLCSTVSISKFAFYSHQQLHKEKQKQIIYECKFCGKISDNKTYHRIHLKTHNSVRNFICSECGLAFIDKKHLKNHHRTHTGERPFLCDVCNKSFAHKSNLTQHKLIHTNVKAFKCNVCERDFRCSSALRKHIKLKHLDENLHSTQIGNK